MGKRIRKVYSSVGGRCWYCRREHQVNICVGEESEYLEQIPLCEMCARWLRDKLTQWLSDYHRRQRVKAGG